MKIYKLGDPFLRVGWSSDPSEEFPNLKGNALDDALVSVSLNNKLEVKWDG